MLGEHGLYYDIQVENRQCASVTIIVNKYSLKWR